MLWWHYYYLIVAGIFPTIYIIGLAYALDRSVVDFVKESLEIPLVFFILFLILAASLLWVIVVPLILIVCLLIAKFGKK